jgi:tetratricopeptide (TPR) repeat protein
VALIAALAASLPARACINEVGTNHRGEVVSLVTHAGQQLKPLLYTANSNSNLLHRAGEVVDRARAEYSFENLNNLAVVLIRLGRLPEAVKLLQYLERTYPGHYQTAANIGTAFELLGQHEDALKWIREGIKRNPDDHHGTEWLHIHILKEKLGRNPTAGTGRSILNLEFGKEAMPRRPANFPVDAAGKSLSLVKVGTALRYQLLERVAFVDAPDAMMAGLLLDWANLELLAGTVESADVLYDAAMRYGSTEKATIALRKGQVAKVLAGIKAKTGLFGGKCELCEPEDEHKSAEH